MDVNLDSIRLTTFIQLWQEESGNIFAGFLVIKQYMIKKRKDEREVCVMPNNVLSKKVLYTLMTMSCVYLGGDVRVPGSRGSCGS